MSKVINQLITRQVQLEIRNVDEENRTAEFVISTETPDTYNTVFKADGAVLDRYNNNPIFTYQHEDWSKDPDDVLGTSELRMEGNQWIAVGKFEDAENDLNEKAEKVFRKVKKKTLRMASIIALPLEGSYGVRELNEDPEIFYFRKWELYSWSVVTHGSNPDALARNIQAITDFKDRTPKIQTTPSAVSRDGIRARIFSLKSI